MLAADGYPGNYERGRVIRGLETLRGWRDGMVFHAGTARRDGGVVTNGGRVLGVTALGADVAAAVRRGLPGGRRGSTGTACTTGATSAGARWSGEPG